jgi:hypothetical protein
MFHNSYLTSFVQKRTVTCVMTLSLQCLIQDVTYAMDTDTYTVSNWQRPVTSIALTLVMLVSFTRWRAPQQMLRTHHSLKAFCATLWWRWAVFLPSFTSNDQWNEIDRGKPTTRRKICPSATLSTTNLTWIDPGKNPGLRSGRPATNRLSHGTAHARLSSSYLPRSVGVPRGYYI